MISLSRIILSLGRWTSKTLSVHFFARRMPTPFVPSELPDQKTLYTESFPFNHRTWERDWDGHSTPFHLVSWRKPQSSLLLVAVSTISALRPLIVPTFILPVRNSSSFGVWILFFLRRSHNSPRWQDRPRSRLPAQPRPGPAATRLLVPALAEISVWLVMREEWGEIFTCGPPLDPNHNFGVQDLTYAAVSRRRYKQRQGCFLTGGRDWNPVYLVDTVRLPFAFTPIFMVWSHSQCCCQSI